MVIKRILTTGQYFCSLLVVCFLPFAETILTKRQPLLAQNNQSAQAILYINPDQGKDGNSGTIDSPLQTITQALKIAPVDAVISLAPGTYSAATGEVFPLIIRDQITLKGVLGGNGRDVIVMGGGSFNSPTGAGQNVTIAALRKTTAIQGLTITNPNDRGHGLWVESANPEISRNTFTRNGNTGLSVNGRSNPLIANNFFRSNSGNGLLIYGQSSPTVTDNLFDDTGFGVSLVQQSRAVISNNTFQGNRIGIIFEGSSQGKLRGNDILNSWEYGLVAIANSKVDLGSSGQAGENVFRGNKKLDIQNLTKNIISATGIRTSGVSEGQIDYTQNAASIVEIASSPSSLASNSPANVSRLRDNPLPSKSRPIARSPIPPIPSITSSNQQAAVTNPSRLSFNDSSANSSSVDSEVLPPPPVVQKPKSPSTPLLKPRVIRKSQDTNSRNGNNIRSTENIPPLNNGTGKEFVFTAPRESNPPPIDRFNDQQPSTLPPPRTTTQRPENLPLPPLKSPSVLGRNSNQRVGSLSDLLGSSRSATSRFRVLVEAGQNNQQKQILSLYPNAKKTVYRGQSMYQVGVFSDRSNAEKVSRSLANLRLTSYILE